LKAFVAGATGATGCRLVRELLYRGGYIKTIVRRTEKLPFDIRTHKHITIFETNILQLNDNAVADYIKDCDAVASCLGHNISLKGIFGNPKYLVTDSVMKLFNTLGREIATLVNSCQTRGDYCISLNMNNVNLSSGIYFYTLSVNEPNSNKYFRDTKVMNL